MLLTQTFKDEPNSDQIFPKIIEPGRNRTHTEPYFLNIESNANRTLEKTKNSIKSISVVFFRIIQRNTLSPAWPSRTIQK